MNVKRETKIKMKTEGMGSDRRTDVNNDRKAAKAEETNPKTEAASVRGMLDNAEMILVGLGEEFDNSPQMRDCGEYIRGVEWLKERELRFLLPAWHEFCLKKRACSDVKKALERLSGLLEGRNYFVVSAAMNGEIARAAWRRERTVMPCGSTVRLQCAGGCGETLREVSAEAESCLREGFEILYKKGEGLPEDWPAGMGRCEICGENLTFNNIYAENYLESGYTEQWQLYLKWLQGTVNRRLTVLELGVGMQFPSVIRWPFEKAVYFNQKAYLYRVNEKLYHLTEELSGKGVGIPQNAIEWLKRL